MPTDSKKPTNFYQRVIRTIKQIPKGRVATYGQVARVAGWARGVRQVVWVLHSSSDKEKLPWHRVINHKGKISLPKYGGYAQQKQLLVDEGVEFDSLDKIDFNLYQWQPKKIDLSIKRSD